MACALLAGLAAASGSALAAGAMATWGNGVGNNAYGQLGDNTTTDRSTPGPIVDANNVLAGRTVVQTSVGGRRSCAVTSDGGAWCWGENFSGELGDGTRTDRSAPVAVVMSGALSGKAVTQISAGEAHICAMTSDGGAWCWGANDLGQLGNGQPSRSLEPVAVALPAGVTVKQIGASQTPGKYACALTSDGRVYCWGDNLYGQLGDGSGGTIIPSSLPINSNFKAAPVAVDLSQLPAGVSVTQISVGGLHSCALTTDGGVYCWGVNTLGQLGIGTRSTTTSTTPVAVDRSGALNGKTVVRIVAGNNQTCALTSDGALYCWGAVNGALAPAPADTAGVLTGKAVVQMSAGRTYVCAVTSDGAGYCWTGTAPAPIDTSVALSGKFLWEISAGSSADRRWPVAEHFAAIAPACGPGIDITSGATAQWHAFSLPLTASASQATVANVFGTGTASNLNTAQYNISNSAAGTGWVIFRHNAATNAYVRLAATDVLTPGVGYWIKSFQKTRTGKLFVDCADTAPPATVTLAQGCFSTNGCRAVSLNSFGGSVAQPLRFAGNPFPWRIDWSKVRVRVSTLTPFFSSLTYTLSEAQELGFMNKQFWVWNGTSYDAYSDSGPTLGSLPYQQSFWVSLGANAQGKAVDLLIPKNPTTLAR